MFNKREAKTDVGVVASDVPLLLLLIVSLLEFDIKIDRDEDEEEAVSNLKLDVLVIRCSSVDFVMVFVNSDELNPSELIFFGCLLRKLFLLLLLLMLLIASNEIKFSFTK